MFLSTRLIKILVGITTIIAAGYLWNSLFAIGWILFSILVVSFIVDATILFGEEKEITCNRIVPQRLSNGDQNIVQLVIQNRYKRGITINIIDEIPVEFQIRDFSIIEKFKPKEQRTIEYTLRPIRRGEYTFQNINIYAFSALHLVERRFVFYSKQQTKVFPSFYFIRNMELLSVDNRTRECGIKLVRRIGNSSEFDQIKKYVVGDDYRTINWKVSARLHKLMCNVYTDEQSQQIFNVIDKGRGMQHTFDGMNLLDYSINAALALSYITIQHNDKAGLITFDQKIDSYVAPRKAANQMEILLENLYRQESTYIQSNYSTLFEFSKKNINKRSLFIIYTTFDTTISLERQLPYIKKIALSHVVLVVFFKDNELTDIVNKPLIKTTDYFDHVIAEKVEFEKLMIVNTLHKFGIHSILTSPQNIRIDVINKYLDMKAKRII